MTTDFESDHEEFAEGPSKSQRKRDMHALQDIGKQLTELKNSQLANIELPDELREAIIEMERMHKREAKRRQLQRIGRLMQLVDGEDIAAQLVGLKTQRPLSILRQYLIVHWLDQLVQ